MKNIISNTKISTTIIFLLGILLYVNTIPHDYAQDDAIVLTKNKFTQKGIQGIPEIFSNDAFYGFFQQDGKQFLVEGGRYRPLSIATFAIEESLFGGNPHISHAINIILYGFIGVILYLVLMALFSKTKNAEIATYLSFLACILYISHPIHTEVVANIKGRDEIFVVLFGLLAMLFFIKKNNTPNKLLSYFFFALALLSKENAIVWTAIIPLSLYFFDTQKLKTDWLKIIPFFLLALGYVIIRHIILGSSNSHISKELMNNPFLLYSEGQMIGMNFSQKWGTIILGLGKYLILLVWPFQMTSDYYPYQIPVSKLTEPMVIISILAQVFMLVTMIWGIIKKNLIGYGLSIYFGALFLVSNIPFSIGTNISERFLFLPSLGICIVLAWLLYTFFYKKEKILTLLFVLITISWSIRTITRNPVWKNDFVLLTTDVRHSPNSAKANHGAAGALSEKSVKIVDVEERKKMVELSNKYAQRAVEIYPLYVNPYLIMGNNYYYLELYDKAIENYEQVLSLDPDNGKALQNMAIALRDGGKYYGEKRGNIQKAIAYLQKAYAINSKDYETVRLLGTAYGFEGNNEKALRYFLEAKDIDPNFAPAWVNVGKAYMKLDNIQEGQRHFKKARELDPNVKM